MATLDQFMRKADWTDQYVADQVGRDRSHITKIRRGKTRPSLGVAVAIERLTKGKVPVSSFAIPEQTAA